MFKKNTLVFVIALFACSNFSMAEPPSENSFHRFWPDNLFAVEFVNDQVGFIAGYSGTLLRTIDGGEQWEALYIGRNELIRNLSFVDENQGWAVGHRGSIFHTKDGGTTWVVQKEIKGVYLRDIDFIDEDNGWVVGHDTHIWHTIDGGNSWKQEHISGLTLRDPPRLHAIRVMDSRTAILAGEFGVIAHTENSGKTWIASPIKKEVTWLSLAGTGQVTYASGLDGSIARLSLATAEEFVAIKADILKEREKLEARARRKAERKKQEYIPKDYSDIPESDIGYSIQLMDSGTNEHLFSIESVKENEAVVVGRSSVLLVSGAEVTAMKSAENFPLPFVWLGGVAITPSGKFWSAGIRGLVVSGNINNGGHFGEDFQLAASDKIKLVSNRWGKKQ